MTTQNRLLAAQLLALAVALVGEFAAADALVTVGITMFFVVLAALFVQMTTALITGLRRSDGRATVC